MALQDHARDYQLEMLEASKKKNVIVAMDTGSGKTLVAILRIRHELEAQSDNHKRVWFLCPTVALAEQQATAVKERLTMFSTRVLCGKDGVDAWTNQSIWDDALRSVDVVVATHAVLADALTHAFVRMADICLLVFDEAHHAANNHPAARVMTFYHAMLDDATRKRPKILGLTASPVVKKGDSAGLQVLETNLCSSVCTPKLHREQLLQHAHRPELAVASYDADISFWCPLMHDLELLYNGMGIEDDPYVKRVKDEDEAAYARAIANGKTYCQITVKTLVNKSREVLKDLGPRLCHDYIQNIAQNLMKSRSSASLYGPTLDLEEEAYLKHLLKPLTAPPSTKEHLEHSPKVHRLLHLFDEKMTDDTRAIIFVKTRAAVFLLKNLLDAVPRSSSLRVGTFVGESEFKGRGTAIELLNPESQRNVLAQLRSGEKNILVCTSVAEEGIDIAACNLVICFDPPSNLKSFVQRRGRARMAKSKYILFCPTQSEGMLTEWELLEQKMVEEYLNEMRERAEVRALEEQDEGDLEYRTEAGARIALQESVAHLHHFVAKLSAHASPMPMFMYQQTGDFRSCRVLLPPLIEPALREHSSTRLWRTEKVAKQEACYQAIVALHKACLLNEHLLPSPNVGEGLEEMYGEIEKRPPMTEVDGQYNAWAHLARLWTSTQEIHTYRLDIRYGPAPSCILLLMPSRIPDISPMTLYIHHDDLSRVDVVYKGASSLAPNEMTIARKATNIIFTSVFGHYVRDDRLDFPAFFVPEGVEDLDNWVQASSGTVPCKGHLDELRTGGIIRDHARWGARYTYQGLEEILMEDGVTTKTMIKAKKLRKRLDFMQPQHIRQPAQTTIKLDPETCTIDRLPLEYSDFALMVPTILHLLNERYTAAALHQGILRSVGFKSASVILPAISTPKASGTEDYQRLELLGDTVLKLLTSITLMAEHLSWPEGYLSHTKGSIVSNGRLAKACEDTGLARFVLSEPFSGAKWRPPLISELLQPSIEPEFRKLSTKTLADVCEAIIGAAYLDGGLGKALAVLRIFIPEVSWQSLPAASATVLGNAHPSRTPAPAHLQQLEDLLGYHFNNPSLLLEALTHSSDAPTSQHRSYERLEFLGDALLDYIVCRTLFNSNKNLAVPRVHRLKTAAVNGAFLAHRALSTSINIPTTGLHTIPITNPETGKCSTQTTISESFTTRSLPDYLRSGFQHQLIANLTSTRQRYQALEADLDVGLSPTSHKYPWTLLAAFDPDKTFSDLLESVLGAVWIDSGGDLSTCETLLRTFGIMQWLEDAIEREVHVWHPKEEVGAMVARMWGREVRYECCRQEEQESRRTGEGEWMRGEGSWCCRLLVGEEMVAEARGWNRMEVETKAAEMAVMRFKGKGAVSNEVEGVIEQCAAEERLGEDMVGRERAEEGSVDDEDDGEDIAMDMLANSASGATLGSGLDGVMDMVQSDVANDRSRKREERSDA